MVVAWLSVTFGEIMADVFWRRAFCKVSDPGDDDGGVVPRPAISSGMASQFALLKLFL